MREKLKTFGEQMGVGVRVAAVVPVRGRKPNDTDGDGVPPPEVGFGDGVALPWAVTIQLGPSAPDAEPDGGEDDEPEIRPQPDNSKAGTISASSSARFLFTRLQIGTGGRPLSAVQFPPGCGNDQGRDKARSGQLSSGGGTGAGVMAGRP
ncbi:hypothetical protein Acsp02_31540 [Actinoplanes sp. NBRC 103695]|nr:hypothetical protein Acsp02_31540 [Actinoplanes sp. NBRC 103695]